MNPTGNFAKHMNKHFMGEGYIKPSNVDNAATTQIQIKNTPMCMQLATLPGQGGPCVGEDVEPQGL